MTLEERGAYVDLLCHEWTDGSISADISELARLLGVTPRKMGQLWIHVGQCFIPSPNRPGRLINQRLEHVRHVQLEFRQSRSIGGVASGRSRKMKDEPERRNEIETLLAAQKKITTDITEKISATKEILNQAIENTDAELNICSTRVEHNANINATLQSSVFSLQSSITPPLCPQGGPVDPAILFHIWNSVRGRLPEVKRFTPERREKARIRLQTHMNDLERYLQDFSESVVRANKSTFLCGGGKNGWTATFDWFIRNNTNYIKVLEGKYETRENESDAQCRLRRTREASSELLGLVDEQAGGSISSGNKPRDAGDVSPKPLGSAARSFG